MRVFNDTEVRDLIRTANSLARLLDNKGVEGHVMFLGNSPA